MPEARTRRFPPPWTVEQIPGGYKVKDDNGQALAYIYQQESKADAVPVNSTHQKLKRACARSPVRVGKLEGRMNDKRSAHPVVLACAADDNYAMPMAVMLYSALKNYRGDLPIHVYVLDGGVSGRHRQKINKVLAPFPISLHWRDSHTETLRDLPVRKYFTVANYQKLLVAELLPAYIIKAIYLDCDLLVEGDLAGLWELDVHDRYFLAAQDASLKLIATSPLAACPEVLFNPDDEYFNSGVLLMNLSRLREDGVAAKVVEFCRRWRSLIRFPDQDGLNAVALGKWGKLDPRWNWLVVMSEKPNNELNERDRNFTYRTDAILHYCGSHKPWRPSTLRSGQADVRKAHRLFDSYARRSGWFTPAERLRYLAAHMNYKLRGSFAQRRSAVLGRD